MITEKYLKYNVKNPKSAKYGRYMAQNKI